jgi:hypothetical protein
VGESGVRNVAAVHVTAATIPARPEQVHSLAKIAILAALWLCFSSAAAFRWLGEGRDYVEYLRYYETIPYVFSFSDTRFEPGFHLIGWVFRVPMNLNYSAFSFFLIGTALAIKFYLMWRHLKYPILAAITYILMLYPLHEYTQIRAALAISLGFLAIHLWQSRNFLYSFTFTLLAFLFHGSTVILFSGFLFGEYFRFNRYGAILVITVAIGAVVAISLNLSIVSVFSIYNPLISKYIENTTFEEDTSFVSLANLLYMTLLAAALFAGWLDDQYRRPFVVMSILSVFALAVFSSSPTVAQRTKEVLFGAIIFAAYRETAMERDIPALAMLWLNAFALGWLSVQNGLLL